MTARFASLIVCASLLAGSSSGREPEHPRKPDAPRTERQCKARGGKWIFYPMLRFHFCAIDTTDAGKPCSDDSQCQGDCLPAAHEAELPGICAPALPAPGACPEHLVKGKIILDPCI
jgi:hypothetical protein